MPKDIGKLPRVAISDELKTKSVGAASVYECDIGSDGKPAEAFCTDCGKLLCAHHEEVHITLIVMVVVDFFLLTTKFFDSN